MRGIWFEVSLASLLLYSIIHPNMMKFMAIWKVGNFNFRMAVISEFVCSLC